MTYNKFLTGLVKRAGNIASRQSSTTFQTSGFGRASRIYGRPLGKEGSPPLFPEAVKETNRLAFAAGSAALVATGIAAGYSLDEDHIHSFMKSNGNTLFLQAMANATFRESVYALRHAEQLHYGIAFEKNDENAVFYRGMRMPDHLDANDQEQVKQWQDDTLQSLTSRGYSPLLWLTRPSATKAEGFNTHPHDGNPARASAIDAPTSWSAEVIAMTCDFDTVKGYSSLVSTSEFEEHGCIILTAPKNVKYLSSTDVKGRHTVNRGHEFEVITPYIDSSDALALLFVEGGKISRVEINEDVFNDETHPDMYSLDVNLVTQLKQAYSQASPDVQPKLASLIATLEKQNKKIDLIEVFESKFNHSVDELIENTKKTIAACDAEIEKMPGVLGMGLRATKRDNAILTRDVVAKKLELPLTDIPPASEEKPLSGYR